MTFNKVVNLCRWGLVEIYHENQLVTYKQLTGGEERIY